MSGPEVGLIGLLLTLILWVLSGIREDLKSLTRRVGEHDSFITALKARQFIGG